MFETFPPGKLPGSVLETMITTHRTRRDESVIVEPSYGFDAAAVQIGDHQIVVKSDPITFATDRPAQYLVTINANDLACLGAIPRWMTVVALLPEHDTTATLVSSLFAELRATCDAIGVSLIGGHTEITMGVDRPLLIGTMIGEVGPHGLLKPGQAGAHDAIYMTESAGLEGASILATSCADRVATHVDSNTIARAARFIDDPGIAISPVASALLATGLVTAMHDPTEGGVATAIHEIAGASHLGAIVDDAAIPVRDETAALCRAIGIDPLGLLSSGSVVCTAPSSAEASLRDAAASVGVQFTRIGTLHADPAMMVLNSGGETRPLPRFDADEITRVL